MGKASSQESLNLRKEEIGSIASLIRKEAHMMSCKQVFFRIDFLNIWFMRNNILEIMFFKKVVIIALVFLLPLLFKTLW